MKKKKTQVHDEEKSKNVGIYDNSTNHNNVSAFVTSEDNKDEVNSQTRKIEPSSPPPPPPQCSVAVDGNQS